MSHRYGSAFVGEDAPEVGLPILESPGWVWIKPVAEGVELYTYDADIWVKRVSISYQEHTHPNLEHLDDIVSLLNSGVTGSITIGGYKITANHGVITSFEAV